MLVLIQVNVCSCPDGFYGTRCQNAKICGYCLHTSCNANGLCSSCPTGLDGNLCSKSTHTSMDTIICNNQGIFSIIKEPRLKTELRYPADAIQDGINLTVEKCHVLVGIVTDLTVIPKVCYFFKRTLCCCKRF